MYQTRTEATSNVIPFNSKAVTSRMMARFSPLFEMVEQRANDGHVDGMSRLAGGWVISMIRECVKEAVRYGWGEYQETFFDTDNVIAYGFCATLRIDLETLHSYVADVLDEIPTPREIPSRRETARNSRYLRRDEMQLALAV